MLSHAVNAMFEDKRLTTVIVVMWLCTVLVTFWSMGVMESHFVSFGPSDETFFMGICLNTWSKWSLVAVFTFVSTAINDFVGDALVPFITNAIQDHKTLYLPYSKFTCWAITQILSVYGCTMSIFSIHLLLSQLDFMLIRMVADSLVNLYTTYRFMKFKEVDPGRYFRSQLPSSDHRRHMGSEHCAPSEEAAEGDEVASVDDFDPGGNPKRCCGCPGSRWGRRGGSWLLRLGRPRTP